MKGSKKRFYLTLVALIYLSIVPTIAQASVSATIIWPNHSDYVLITNDPDEADKTDKNNIITVHDYENGTYYFVRVTVNSTSDIGTLALLFDTDDDGNGDIAIEVREGQTFAVLYTWSGSYWDYANPTSYLADHAREGNWPTSSNQFVEVAINKTLVDGADNIEVHIIGTTTLIFGTTGGSTGTFHAVNNPSEAHSIFADEVSFTTIPTLFEAPLFTLLVISSVVFLAIRRRKEDKKKKL